MTGTRRPKHATRRPPPATTEPRPATGPSANSTREQLLTELMRLTRKSDALETRVGAELRAIEQGEAEEEELDDLEAFALSAAETDELRARLLSNAERRRP